jgi:CxxC-x17-CxxC domain-containing protein
MSARPRYAITCSKCGASDTVPFQPSDERSVHCRSCFTKMRQEMGTDPKNIWSERKKLGAAAPEHRRGERSEDGCSQRLGVLNATRVQT